jgi:hypothetical protein
LKKAIFMIAKMGGFLGRISNDLPGTQSLWRGLQRLDTDAEMFAVFTHQDPDPMQSGS